MSPSARQLEHLNDYWLLKQRLGEARKELEHLKAIVAAQSDVIDWHKEDREIQCYGVPDDLVTLMSNLKAAREKR